MYEAEFHTTLHFLDLRTFRCGICHKISHCEKEVIIPIYYYRVNLVLKRFLVQF